MRSVYLLELGKRTTSTYSHRLSTVVWDGRGNMAGFPYQGRGPSSPPNMQILVRRYWRGSQHGCLLKVLANIHKLQCPVLLFPNNMFIQDIPSETLVPMVLFPVPGASVVRRQLFCSPAGRGVVRVAVGGTSGARRCGVRGMSQPRAKMGVSGSEQDTCMCP